jgi:hypothetical protein
MSDVVMRQRQVQVTACHILTPNIPSSPQNPHGTVDVLSVVQRIDLYESVFQNTISGNVVLTEDVGWIEYLPMVGIEHLYLQFIVTGADGEDQTYSRMFRITKVHDQTFIRHQNRTYVIEFATPEFVGSVANRISRRFKNMTCADAVRDIVEKDLGVSPHMRARFVSPSPVPTWGKIDVTIANYTPLRAINYFAMLSLEDENQYSGGYLFFETLKGLYFTSIAGMYRDAKRLDDIGHRQGKETIPTIRVNPAAQGPSNDDRDAIFRIHQEQTFDLLAGIASGFYAARVFHFDLLAQKFRCRGVPVSLAGQVDQTDSLYTDTFEKTKQLHSTRYPLTPKYFEREFSPNVRQFMVPTNSWSTANTETAAGKTALENEQLMHKSIAIRNRQLREIRQIETLVELPGQPGVHAGSLVDLRYPMSEPLERFHPTLTPHSGIHLVTSVHHTLVIKDAADFDYRMSLRVAKSSLNRPFNVAGT